MSSQNFHAGNDAGRMTPNQFQAKHGRAPVPSDYPRPDKNSAEYKEILDEEYESERYLGEHDLEEM